MSIGGGVLHSRASPDLVPGSCSGCTRLRPNTPACFRAANPAAGSAGDLHRHARLDILTAGQHRAIQASTGWSNVLAENEAIVMLGALAYGHRSEYATFRDSDQYRHAEAALKRAAILAAYTTAQAFHADQLSPPQSRRDVAYELRLAMWRSTYCRMPPLR